MLDLTTTVYYLALPSNKMRAKKDTTSRNRSIVNRITNHQYNQLTTGKEEHPED